MKAAHDCFIPAHFASTPANGTQVLRCYPPAEMPPCQCLMTANNIFMKLFMNAGTGKQRQESSSLHTEPRTHPELNRPGSVLGILFLGGLG